MAKHYVEVSDAVWAELVRIQKLTKVDKHALTDDVFALAGDLEAIAENHVDVPDSQKVDAAEAALTKEAWAKVESEDERREKHLTPNVHPPHSTRAAVLEPTTAEELADLI